MATHPNHPTAPGAAAGADVGATLVKLALRDPLGETTTEVYPAAALDGVVERIGRIAPERVGVTGGGAPRLARRLPAQTVSICEFEAWAAGARVLLGRDGEAPEDFLLVSVGTGTSAMRVRPGAVTRVGGTALGGGTVLGLGAALTAVRDFDALTALAARGDRRRVDLLVADIYPEGDLPLPGDLNAASFAKLGDPGVRPDPADLAHAVMGLVGENVGLICGGLAHQLAVDRIVFGGSTLRGNAPLCEILATVCSALGRTARFLAEGQFAGALGALALGAGASR